ncbi:hypothetical protein [Pseudomarimonas arenosa]|uniref:Uncharacterized protein n=1 Tax=Pseudomarimonas arenosa TaxID=2774145 RepID=A0AAW3ZP29_9GAMM|nr:hypothetical protein [Pseudomarimonas arenosa]MBD8526387.1 hypothetical protein [Pseudomarimonas arenosa]
MGAINLTPDHIVAIRAPDSSNPRQDRTIVFLSNTAMDEAALTNQRDAYVSAINDPALNEQNYLTVFIADDGHASVNAKVGDVQYVESTKPIFGEPGSLKLECQERSAAKLDCRVWVDGPVKVESGDPWTLDMKFSAAVIPKLSGKAIAADGGEAGKALMAFAKALKGDSLDAVFEHMSEGLIAQYNADYQSAEENLESLKSVWSSRMPEKLKISGGEQVSEELIFIRGEGEMFPGMNALYEFDMRRRDGRWVVDDGGSVGILR